MIVYDCVFVFATDVMVKVATSIDNPMKFIFPSDLFATFSGGEVTVFSMIGFGDVFIPALLTSLALRMDFIRAFASVKREMTLNNGVQRHL